MRGRVKGERERIIALAHQTATMTGHLYSKAGLKPLAKYLEPPKAKRGAGAVVAMMRRMHQGKE